MRVSVNIAARQFQQQNLAEVVACVLQETKLEARLLMLEITESTVMRDAGAAIETLREIASLGVGLSVDDFGTGYSSLSYLKRFPPRHAAMPHGLVIFPQEPKPGAQEASCARPG